ncbi:hypothetical protein AgCh_014454 [Apium graveolens]
MSSEEENRIIENIGRILEEAKASNATHIRKLKDLSSIKSSSPLNFFSAFSKTLAPLFNYQRRVASAERIVRFVSAFATTPDCDEFLQDFVRLLIVATAAANKTARFRACQIISELPDDTEVSDDLWDEVIDCLKSRITDKVPMIRACVIRALSRFTNDAENSDILELFLQSLPREQNADVRKTILLCLPPSSATSQVIIDRTLDISESVRKTAYFVLASKFPVQSLSIKLRTIILRRGLADRSTAVVEQCLALIKDEWLMKSCSGDPIVLLRYLDVETYELVGESVMEALLHAGLGNVQESGSLKQYNLSTRDDSEGQCNPHIQLMEPEPALYWRTVCKHLHAKAQAKGSDAAMTMGSEAAVYAAEASDTNDLLEKVLPETVSEYVELVKAHIAAGPNCRFTSRQLLLLGEMIDFSDSSNRKVAGAFIQELLEMPPEHELDDDGNEVVIGDGINLGGDRKWAEAVSGLAKKVYSASGEFEEVFLGVIEKLARPCRERTANFVQWMHCLSVTGLILENANSFRWMLGKSIEPAELLLSLLLPGAKHIHVDIQRAAIRCLGLFGLLEKKPSEELTKQLLVSFAKGFSPISAMAGKALIDLSMWHGPHEISKAITPDLASELQEAMPSDPIKIVNPEEEMGIKLLDLLLSGLERFKRTKITEVDEDESVQAVLGEGFAKILLLSDKYPTIPASSHPLLLEKLMNLYFCSEITELWRLKQCLSVFFEHYSSLSVNHKKCMSRAFIPIMRSMWPGIDGNPAGSPVMVSNMRKRAVQASRFMLQMFQTPLYAKEREQVDGTCSSSPSDGIDEENSSYEFENGEEGLAIRIAAEAVSFPSKKTAAEKAYLVAICKIIPMLHFRVTEQGPIKLMRCLLNRAVESVSLERELSKELKRVAERLQTADKHQEQDLHPDQANLILGRLQLKLNLNQYECTDIPTPVAPRSTRPPRPRRRAKDEESSSEDETSPKSVVPNNPAPMSIRSQRASKTAAMNKIANTPVMKIVESDEDDEEESASELMSEDQSDESFD